MLACWTKYGRKESLLNIPFRYVKSPERGGYFSRFRAFHFLGVEVNNEWRRRRAFQLLVSLTIGTFSHGRE